PVQLHFFGYHRFRGGQLLTAALEVRRHYRAQIVQVVEEDVIEYSDIGGNVARQCNIEDAQRTIAALAHRGLDLRALDHRVRRRGGAQQDVDIGEPRPTIVVAERFSAVPFRERHRALVRAVGNDRGADALAHETLEREIRHVTGA